MIFSSFFKALGQVGDPRFRRILGLGIGLSIALLVAFNAGLLWLLQWTMGDEITLPLIGEVTWLGDLLTWSSFFVLLIFSVVLMVPVASTITSMFLDDVAQAVEDKHYRHLPKATKVPFGDAFRDTVNFLGILIAANAIAFFFYAMFAVFSPLIFWSLNGYLLGMEYFQLAAMRRIGRTEAKAMRRRNRLTIWTAGTLMAIPLSFPLINLVIPILGAATFTHIFHAVQAREKVPV